MCTCVCSENDNNFNVETTGNEKQWCRINIIILNNDGEETHDDYQTHIIRGKKYKIKICIMNTKIIIFCRQVKVGL